MTAIDISSSGFREIRYKNYNPPLKLIPDLKISEIVGMKITKNETRCVYLIRDDDAEKYYLIKYKINHESKTLSKDGEIILFPFVNPFVNEKLNDRIKSSDIFDEYDSSDDEGRFIHY